MVATRKVAELCIYILTWNVWQNQPNLTADLSPILPLNDGICPNNTQPDIYAVGLQESTKSENLDVINYILSYILYDDWTGYILKHINSRGNQYFLVENHLWNGLNLMLFIHQKHISSIYDIEKAGTYGSYDAFTGAVSIRMSLYGFGVVFLNSKLSRNEDGRIFRNQEYYRILESHRYTVRRYHSILSHEFVFWFGDLNYRLDNSFDRATIRAHLDARNVKQMLQADELTIARNTGLAFDPFSEPEITFYPTCMLNPCVQLYKAFARPAWCDRILYRVLEKYDIYQVGLSVRDYTAHFTFGGSYHRPVSAQFRMMLISETGREEDVYRVTHGWDGQRTFTTPLWRTLLFWLIWQWFN